MAVNLMPEVEESHVAGFCDILQKNSLNHLKLVIYVAIAK
jgi:hypothetical protein